MKIRTILTATLLITSLVTASGCDSALIHDESKGEMNTAQMALTHSQGSATDEAGLITDRPDSNSIVAPTHLIESPVYYPNRESVSCLSDGQHDSTDTNLYTRPSDCCRVHFGWKYDACLADTRLTANDLPSTYDVADQHVDNGGLIRDEEALSVHVPSTIHVPEEADDTTKGTSDVAGMDTIDVDESDEDVEFYLPSTVQIDHVADEDDTEDEELDEEVSIYGDSANCPEGWTYQEIDCSYVTARNGLAHRCNQLLVPSTTSLCGEHDRDGVVCLVPDHDTSSTFGMGDGPGMAQQRCVNVDEAF